MVDRDPHQRLVHGCDEAQYGRSHGEDGRAREDAENRVTATRQEMPTSGQPPGLSRQGKTRRRESAIQYASRILRSRRLFPVGPVSIASPSALKNGYASNLSSAARALQSSAVDDRSGGQTVAVDSIRSRAERSNTLSRNLLHARQRELLIAPANSGVRNLHRNFTSRDQTHWRTLLAQVAHLLQ